jgi:hypothetical protein
MLLHRHRVVGAALDGGVVADDHHLAPGDAADAGDHAGAMHILVVHVIGGERADLEEGRAGVEQAQDAFPRQ